MTKKLILFDIDGTLLDKDKNLPYSTKRAIYDLKQKGHEVAIATGRPLFMFENLCKELNINTFIGSNGQYVVVNGDVIYENPLHIDLIHDLTTVATENNHPLIYVNDQDMRSNIEYHPYIEESIKTLKLGRHVEYNPHFFKENNIFHMILTCKDQEEYLYTDIFEQLKFIRWHPFAVDVLYRDTSKASGIQKIIERLNVHEDDIYAFGDEINDIEMLQFVKNSVAMGNAPNIVKESAKYITKDVHDNGIAHGLKKLGLLS